MRDQGSRGIRSLVEAQGVGSLSMAVGHINHSIVYHRTRLNHVYRILKLLPSDTQGFKERQRQEMGTKSNAGEKGRSYHGSTP